MQCSQPVRSAGHIVRYFTITKRLLACSRHWSRVFAYENTVNWNDTLMTQINIFLRLSRCDFPRNFTRKNESYNVIFKKPNWKLKRNKTKQKIKMKTISPSLGLILSKREQIYDLLGCIQLKFGRFRSRRPFRLSFDNAWNKSRKRHLLSQADKLSVAYENLITWKTVLTFMSYSNTKAGISSWSGSIQSYRYWIPDRKWTFSFMEEAVKVVKNQVTILAHTVGCTM